MLKQRMIPHDLKILSVFTTEAKKGSRRRTEADVIARRPPCASVVKNKRLIS
jgi:hypothetical protein